MVRKQIIVLLALILVLQPVASAFAGCMQMDASGHSTHNGMQMDGSHKMHHAAMNNTDDKTKQNGCFTDCHCAGKCLHACNAVSIISVESLFMFERNNSEYFIAQYFSQTGYKFLLLRPPTVIS